MNNINPFNLLGVTINSSHKEVRRAYYKLSLICHPDKGGSKDDMIMLHNAYNYVMEQIEFSEKAEMLENVKEDFKNFFEKNKTEIPPFYELWERSEEAEFLREFNKNFEGYILELHLLEKMFTAKSCGIVNPQIEDLSNFFNLDK